ncbi:MAG: ABC transporter ATP-binding protein [Candidatus Heimdallarchaeota archaeon]
MSVVIETKNLTKNFDGRIVVDHLNLRIYRGEILSLLGPNGAGKTTTIKMLTTILKPDQGSAYINRYDIQKNKKDIRKLISIVPQEIVLYDDLSGLENLLFFGKLHNIPISKLKTEAENILRALGLAKRSDKVKNYSGGLKRRLNFGICTIMNTEILFLDEPTAGLDPQARNIIWQMIKDKKKEGKTIILTTHDMYEAEILSDRVLIIDNGKIIAEGSPNELKDRYSEHNILELKYKLNSPNLKKILTSLDFVRDVIINGDVSTTIYFDGTMINFIEILNQKIINDVSELEYMRLRQNTLEDVFLKLTGRRLRE